MTSRITSIVLAIAGLLAFADQKSQYDAEAPKTIVELQQFRQSASIGITARGKEGTATLVNLNPTIGIWYLLTVAWKDGTPGQAWHLENPAPHQSSVLLDEKYAAGVVIVTKDNHYSCDLFRAGTLEQGKASPLIYYPLCGGRLYLRNGGKGHRTTLEKTTEFLREQVPGGESLIVLFHHLMADRYRETGALQVGKQSAPQPRRGLTPDECPAAAEIGPEYAGRQVVASSLGIELEGGQEKSGMTAGAWYAALSNPGICVSILQPNFIAPAILRSYKTLVNDLDRVEASSLAYLVAFDLDRFDLGYALGTEHPEVGWSARATGPMKNPLLPGPDGIGAIAPLVSTGLVRPDNDRKTVATFTAGFKRTHGAFRSGELALRNHASHYGFIENGVVFSKLQPGLATVFVLDDGSVDMRTWTEADNKLLGRARHARQNGVPLVESGAPGGLVARWGAGNWSGSENEKLRTIRAGLAIGKIHGKRFLIYAVFSDATPSAMARVFQAYQVNYAMLLDMNALEHTYLAVYRRSGSDLAVDHVLRGMNQQDKSASGENVPRFLGYPDNRDFFYVMRRGTEEVAGGVKP